MSACISSGGKEIMSQILNRLDILAKDPEQKVFMKQLKKDLAAMPICATTVVSKVRKPKKPRKLSKWNLCIKEKTAGKPFSRQAMKNLSPEYKAGNCPSKEFLEKFRRGEIS